MCEWLSYSDWCDVRLLCEGGSFNAHRAVLASVSNFLRRVLLSCPVDDLPVLIFLPDFDLKVMSSVLYYIYNGEVLIPKDKLKMFLETANAMEIFIDQRHIFKENEYNKNCFKSRIDNEILTIENYNICQLRLCERNNECFVNVRKDLATKQVVCHMQKHIGHLNPIQTFCRWSEESISNLRNLRSLSGYEQKQSFLRDIFIETYSQDSNGGEQRPDVLEKTNEGNRSLTSVHFNNPNEIQPSTVESNTRISNKMLPQSSQTSSIFRYFKQLQESNYKDSSTGNVKISYTVCSQLNAENFNPDSTLGNSLKEQCTIKNDSPLQISLPLLAKDSASNSTIQHRCSFSSLSHIEQTLNQHSTDINKGIFQDECRIKNSKCTHKEASRTIAKVYILNEVIQSPWHYRQPDSYRPSQKNNQMVSYAIHPNDDLENKDFTKRNDYSVQNLRPSSSVQYSCDKCHKTFSQLRNYKYHMSVHRGTNEFAATCSVCGKHFNDRGYLSNHMKIHRNRKEYKCGFCPKSFNQRVAFNMHVRIHTGVKPHVCEECGKAFSRKMLLKQHQRTHSGERPYACAHCDKRFADRSNMTLHLRLHTGVKPFSCTLCPKSFTKKHHLKSHLNFHTGAKPYSCPRCQLTFTQSSNMRTHFKKCNTIN